MGGGYVPDPGQPRRGQTPSYSFSSLVPIRHWARDPALRSWPVLLLITLVCVPPIALVMLNHPTEAKIRDIAWIFAIYFAVAWLLLLGVIVRPQHVTRSMLAAVAVIGIVTQAPIAIFLETELHSSTGSLLDVFTIGIPEELAKAIPIVAVAWIWRRQWRWQTPRDYLFLGAVSGLVFGAAEVVHYFTDVLGSLSGNVNGLVLQDITIQYVWRFLTDPIDHACWAGITGYFIGLAITGPYQRYSLGVVGIGIAAVLHGLNDWNPVNSHVSWVLVTLISVLLFLGYARAGAWLPQQADASPDGMHAVPGQWSAAGQPPAYRPARHSVPEGHPAPAGHGSPTSPEPWWQAAAADGGAARPAHATRVPPDNAGPPRAAAAPQAAASRSATTAHSAPPVTVPPKAPPKPAAKPWWEQ